MHQWNAAPLPKGIIGPRWRWRRH